MRRPSPTPSGCSSSSSDPTKGTLSFTSPTTSFTFLTAFRGGATSLSFMAHRLPLASVRLRDDLADLLGLLLGRADLGGQLAELAVGLLELLGGLADLLGQPVQSAAGPGHLHPEHLLGLAGVLAAEHHAAYQAGDRPRSRED